jgi:hypothetical protein
MKYAHVPWWSYAVDTSKRSLVMSCEIWQTTKWKQILSQSVPTLSHKELPKDSKQILVLF